MNYDEIEGIYANVNNGFTHEDEENGITFTNDIDTVFCSECGVKIGNVEEWLMESASTDFLECDDCLSANLEQEITERIDNLINYNT